MCERFAFMYDEISYMARLIMKLFQRNFYISGHIGYFSRGVDIYDRVTIVDSFCATNDFLIYRKT